MYVSKYSMGRVKKFFLKKTKHEVKLVLIGGLVAVENSYLVVGTTVLLLRRTIKRYDLVYLVKIF
jgi:hypothetical protein